MRKKIRERVIFVFVFVLAAYAVYYYAKPVQKLEPYMPGWTVSNPPKFR
jgi:hypothetical protein